MDSVRVGTLVIYMNILQKDIRNQVAYKQAAIS
jgi:hypothetical protein